jgi:hypothetical protein
MLRMSRTTQSTALRTLASAFLAAGLAAPAAAVAQAVTSERTLLNRVAAPSHLSAEFDPAPADATRPGAGNPVDGSVALLGRTPARMQRPRDPRPVAIAPAPGIQTDGERALLEHAAPAGPRRAEDRSWPTR